MKPLEYPSRINVEVTNRCNQRCRCCPREGFTRPLGLMEPALFEMVATETAAHETTLWLHFLGEPLLHPKLVEMIEFACDAGVRSVGLSTNATLLRGDLMDGLISSGLHRLDCSIDADDAVTYRSMRGTDDFDRVTENVAAFLERRSQLGASSPTVGLQLVLTPEVRASVPAIRSRWEPLLSQQDFIKTIEPATFGGSVAEGVLPLGRDRPPCQWLFTSLMVLQDGTVTMCGVDWDAQAPLGVIEDARSIERIWNGDEVRRRRAAHLERRFGDVALCGTCTDWHLADGHGYRNVRDRQPTPTEVSPPRSRRSGADR